MNKDGLYINHRTKEMAIFQDRMTAPCVVCNTSSRRKMVEAGFEYVTSITGPSTIFQNDSGYKLVSDGRPGSIDAYSIADTKADALTYMEAAVAILRSKENVC